MKITYFGHSYFLVEGKEYSICLDPFSNVGFKEVEVNCDYVFSSHSHFDHNNIVLAKGAKLVTNGYPFEIIKTYHDEKLGALRGENSLLIFTLDGFRIAFLGDLGEFDNKGLVDKLNGVDLLLIPVGGKYTIDAVGAYNYAVKSKAKCVIPMHYKTGASTIDIDSAEPFLNKFKNYQTANSPMEFNGQTGVIKLIFEEN